MLDRSGRKHLFLASLGILCLSGFFSFYRIFNFPPGLWHDEAMNGISALKALDTGSFRLFYPENFGREGLLINLQSLLLHYFSPQPYLIRAPCALFGMMTVLFVFLFTYELFSSVLNREHFYSLRVALFASILIGSSFWHVALSRIGVRAILSSFFLVSSLYFLLLGLKYERGRQSLAAIVVAALLSGLGFYTYIPFRIAPLIILLAFLIAGKKLYPTLKRSLCFLVVLSLTTLPLVLYFLENPQHFMGRISTFSNLKSNSYLLDFYRALEFIFSKGTPLPRHGPHGEPLIPWLLTAALIFGLFWEVAKSKKLRESKREILGVSFILFWFLIGLLPGIFAPAGANRLILAMIPLFIFAGAGLNALYISLRSAGGSQLLSLAPALIAVGTFIVYNYQIYLVNWANNIRVKTSFNSHVPEVAQYLLSSKASTRYVILRDRTSYLPAAGVRFLTRTYSKELEESNGIYFVKHACPNIISTSVDCVILGYADWRTSRRNK